MDNETRWAVDSIRRRRRRPATGRAVRHAVAQVLSRLRVGEAESRRQLREAWQEAVPSIIAEYAVPTRIRNRVLNVVVADSLVSQEIALQQAEIIANLQRQLPDRRIEGIRCEVGRIQD